MGENTDQPFFQLEHVLHRALDVAGRALSSAGDLMDHDIGVRQRVSLPFGTGGQKDRSHARGNANAVSGHVASDVLHRVVNRQTGRHRATGRINVNIDIPLRILHLEKQHLSDD